MPNTWPMNDSSHAYSFKTLIPLMISVIILMRPSFSFICKTYFFSKKTRKIQWHSRISPPPPLKTNLVKEITCKLRARVVMTALIGTMSNIVPRPASTDGPSACHRKYSARAIWSGADQMRWSWPIRSMNRCESTDIKLTISPLTKRKSQFGFRNKLFPTIPVTTLYFLSSSPTVLVRFAALVIRSACQEIHRNNWSIIWNM